MTNLNFKETVSKKSCLKFFVKNQTKKKKNLRDHNCLYSGRVKVIKRILQNSACFLCTNNIN